MIRPHTKTLALSLSLLFICLSVAAHASTKSRLTLEDIYQHKLYKLQRPGKSVWQDDGESYTIVEDSKNTPDAKDIVRYNTATGEASVLVSAKQLMLAKDKKAADIDGYSIAKNNKQLLLFTNTQKTWRHRKSGDYWLIDLESNTRKKNRRGSGNLRFILCRNFSGRQLHCLYVQTQPLYTKLTRLEH